MTENIELSDCEKTIMNVDEPIYGDLITEIELVDDPATDDKVKDSLTDLADKPPAENTEIPTDAETFVASDVLTQDDAVSEFFTVDAKADDFDNDMMIGELDTEGIDFKNDTDIAECHHEYESKKLLFGDCEDIVEVVNSEVEEKPEDAEVVEPEAEKSEPIPEEIEACFEIATTTEENLNRMHVMEDVEEGCDVSGALPSSPGHAEQRPDPPKISSTETSTPVEETSTNETTETTTLPADKSPPAQNGLSELSPEPESVSENTDTPEKPTEVEVEDCKKSPEPIDNVETQPDSPKEVELSSQDDQTIEETKKEDIQSTENESETKPNSPPAESLKEEVKRDNEEDSSSSESSQSTRSSKRKCDDDDSNISPPKKLRSQIQLQYANHDRILSEYIESSNCGTVEDLQVQTEQLLAEIRTLSELAREKEREWNNILHVKKVKEELLLRMQRKKQILLMNSGLGDKNDMDWDISEQNEDQNMKNNTTKQNTVGGNGNLMMVPVVSSSPAGNHHSKSPQKQDKIYSSKPRSILPKNSNFDINGQAECRQGRQGPILDVKSIIADYRQRHPETVPRRGRRLKSVLNPSHNDTGGKMTASGNVLSMASLALGSGSQVRHGNTDVSSELGLLLSTMDSVRQENSRPSSADSSMTSLLGSNSEAAMSFKDVLVQFARLSQSERQELQAQAAASLAAAVSQKPPPPPYPEVTLHPVPTVQSNQVPTTQNSSLLHGILTKAQPRTDSKPTTFSPTLARLLTAPERVSNNNAQAMYTAALNSGVSISDLLSTTGKSRNEITITPVGQYGQNMKQKNVEHLEEDEAEDSADRLVIDEGTEASGGDRNRADNGSETGDDVPQCQGCHQKSAQFVCAGCGNQWYCSRDCQVAAWDEHSEVCSG